MRGDSILAWDHHHARATLLAPDGTFARQIQYPPTLALYVATTASQRLAGFPLPVQREHADSEWGRTPLISIHASEAAVVQADTLDVPVWLRCESSARNACRPLADTLQARRGTLAVAGDFVYAIRPMPGWCFGIARSIQVLRIPSRFYPMHTPPIGSSRWLRAAPARCGSASAAPATRFEDRWLRIVPGTGVERAVLLPSTERVVAAQAECVVVRTGVTLRIHLLDVVRSDVPCSATDSQHDAFSAAADAPSAAQSADDAEARWSLTRLWRVGAVDGPETLAFHDITHRDRHTGQRVRARLR